MTMLLVPLDGSALAEQVLPSVRLLAPLLNAQIRLLQVCVEREQEPIVNTVLAAAYGVPEALEHQREREAQTVLWQQQNAEHYLLDQARHLQRAGLMVEIDIRYGSPAGCIADVAAALPDALIAMATHGYGGLRRWSHGSIADKVLQHVRVPMLLVRGMTEATAPVPTLKRILVPWDGSTLARAALPYALALARAAGAELLLLRAVAPLVAAAGDRQQQGRPESSVIKGLVALHDQVVGDLEVLATDLRREAVAVTTAVEPGDSAAAVIATAAARCSADLIVMATHGYGGLRRLALGSVADSVLHTTHIPIMLVPA